MDCGVAAIDQFKKKKYLRSNYFDDLLSGVRSLPFGLLVLCYFLFCQIYLY